MNASFETGTASKRLLRVMVPTALALWAFVAMGTTTNYSANLDGRYSSTGQVLLSNGQLVQVSQSVVFNDGRFYSMTRNSPAIVEASGRVETDFLGRARLVVEEGQISGIAGTDELDEELIFNLFYGKHKGARITLEEVGACLYGVETQQVYCAEPAVAQL
ncbi:hypothetical protein [Pseudomonas songnenensis]|jgi:hypothetical protein|uniref:Uncharacterized protein n=1 Tax=Pseudomonas songnenensis TaxID=1176259 RepID=A0A482U749_9PSED|nr:hypothetical protein [Pseudomonas songnenensis]AWM59655.1 hypothetical protein C6Y58_09240 [Stutzerimonas stutzeri]MCQ4300621.1 hypothetical protein [Pseudomonas songnenensis]RMH96950.1 hypothetical protein EA798_11165 [Pseudomonas songnenensis]RYJ63029.1 hypothetical protein EJA06_009215 [Pseudomonas songnenensis]